MQQRRTRKSFKLTKQNESQGQIMHIAILQAGRTNPDMPAEFQDYPDMFETLFAAQTGNDSFTFSNVPVIDGVFPERVDDYDGYLITGSAYGVYDDAPFIPKLMASDKA